MTIERNRLYCHRHSNAVVLAISDPFVSNDYEMRTYFHGNRLDMDSGAIAHQEMRPYEISDIVPPEKLLSLQTMAIEKQFSLTALKLLGITEIPDYIKCFKVGSIHRHQKFTAQLIIVKKNDYPTLECLEIHMDPIRIFDSKCNAHNFNPSPLKKSTLQFIVKKIELGVAKEILSF